jgi:hypothetical protein
VIVFASWPVVTDGGAMRERELKQLIEEEFLAFVADPRVERTPLTIECTLSSAKAGGFGSTCTRPA